MNINKYKEKLLREKNKLTGLIGEMKDNTLFGNTTNHTSEKYTSGELSSYDNHPADIGTDVYMQDMQNSLTNHEQGRLNNIEDALYRIESGTYGICDICHNANWFIINHAIIVTKNINISTIGIFRVLILIGISIRKINCCIAV